MLNYTNIFIPNDYEKNGKIIYNTSNTNTINENVILVFRLKNIKEIRNYLLEEIII